MNPKVAEAESGDKGAVLMALNSEGSGSNQ